MHIELTDEQRDLQQTIRQFAKAEIEPVAGDLDRQQEYPEVILNQLGAENLTGLTLPTENDGLGLGLVEAAIVFEELAAAHAAVAGVLELHLMPATLIDRFGTTQLKETYLGPMARFETVGTLGLTEANAGSDVLAMGTTAERDSDEWELTGQKRWVFNFPRADVVAVFAKTGPDVDAPRNITAFLVPTEEFEVVKTWDVLGANGVDTCEVALTDVRVPADHIIGEEGTGLMQLRALNGGIKTAATGVGIARAALDDTLAYVHEREQFGQPIGDFQGVRWKLAEMAIRVETARLLALRAADHADRGRRDLDQKTSMAKLYAAETAVANASEAMQIHGGVGYTSEYAVERYFRDAKLLTIAGGSNDLHRNTVGDSLLAG